jgi:hypothetical protein
MRNIYFDLNELLSCKIKCAALVEVNGTRVVGEPFDPAYVLHVLVDDDAVVGDFGTKNAYAYEYVDDLPSELKNPDGTPKHSFAGVPIYQNQDARLTAESGE